jgi:hypothetical protein
LESRQIIAADDLIANADILRGQVVGLTISYTGAPNPHGKTNDDILSLLIPNTNGEFPDLAGNINSLGPLSNLKMVAMAVPQGSVLDQTLTPLKQPR